jgi:hypothetical protein
MISRESGGEVEEVNVKKVVVSRTESKQEGDN